MRCLGVDSKKGLSMRKMLLAMGILSCMMGIGAGTLQAQQIGIDAAIRSVAEGLSAGIGTGASVAVLSMQADSARMSDYLIDETISALMGLQSGLGFTTINRVQFDQLMGGLHVNMAGPIGDATIRTAGGLLNARYVITGTFEPLAGFFRFRAQLIEVQTAAIRGTHTADVLNDSLVAYLMLDARPASAPVPTPAAVAQPVPPPVWPTHSMEIGQFTIGQRWATLFLNGIPGLGSFVIMEDRFGGMFQVICAGLGFTLMIAANTFLAGRIYPGGVLVRYTNSTVWTFGWLMIATWQVYSVVRSFTFGRNSPPRVAAMTVPWDIAFTPGGNGIEGITLSHTRRF